MQPFGNEQDVSSASLSNYEAKPVKPQQYAGHVVINDLTTIMPVSRQLGERYLM